MNPGWRLLAPLLALGACSLLHDELPNDPPTVHLARMTCQSPGKASPDTLINSAGCGLPSPARRRDSL